MSSEPETVTNPPGDDHKMHPDPTKYKLPDLAAFEKIRLPLTGTGTSCEDNPMHKGAKIQGIAFPISILQQLMNEKKDKDSFVILFTKPNTRIDHNGNHETIKEHLSVAIAVCPFEMTTKEEGFVNHDIIKYLDGVNIYTCGTPIPPPPGDSK